MLTISDPTTVPAPPGGLHSPAARVDVGGGALVFVSGQVALDDAGQVTGDMAQQSERVFDVVAAVAG